MNPIFLCFLFCWAGVVFGALLLRGLTNLAVIPGVKGLTQAQTKPSLASSLMIFVSVALVVIIWAFWADLCAKWTLYYVSDFPAPSWPYVILIYLMLIVPIPIVFGKPAADKKTHGISYYALGILVGLVSTICYVVFSLFPGLGHVLLPFNF